LRYANREISMDIAPSLSELAALIGDRRPSTAALIEAVRGQLPAMQARAPELDRLGAFPAADVAALGASGVLLAPVPARYGGLGLGTEAGGGVALFDLLRLIGRGNMAVGRIIEGHVNALQLIGLYGSETQIADAAADAAEGHLFAIWNTEAPPGVRLADGFELTGRKDHGSAAGFATRAVITVDHPARSQMLLVRLEPGERAGASAQGLHGMRATRSGWIDFDGYVPHESDWIGGVGDYLREPAFSVGAWRALAVLLGGIDALVEALRGQLRARRRDANPHQAARIAHALIAQETASLWTRKAACLADGGAEAEDDVISYVNLARRSVEIAGLEVVQLVQRSLGLAAFADTNVAERLMRDLATYLRQPALDEAIEGAAAHFVAAGMP